MSFEKKKNPHFKLYNFLMKCIQGSLPHNWIKLHHKWYVLYDMVYDIIESCHCKPQLSITINFFSNIPTMLIYAYKGVSQNESRYPNLDPFKSIRRQLSFFSENSI